MHNPRKKDVSRQLAPRPDAPEQPPKRWRESVILLAAFAMMVAFLVREPERRTLLLEDINTAVLSRQDIRADFYFQSVDLQKTKEARNAAAAKVPDNFRVDEAKVSAQLEKVREQIARITVQREAVTKAVLDALRNSTETQPVEEVVRQTVSSHVASLRQDAAWKDAPAAPVLALWLTPDITSLPKRVFEEPAEAEPEKKKGEPAEPAPRRTVALNPEPPGAPTFSTGEKLAALTLENLEDVLRQGIRPAELAEEMSGRSVIIVRDNPSDDVAVSSGEVKLGSVPDPAAAETLLAGRLRETARDAADSITEETGEWARLHEAALAVGRMGLADTIVEDRVATAGAIQAARDAVPEVLREIEAGEIIQEGGRRWTEQSRHDVKTYIEILSKEQQAPLRFIGQTLAHALIVLFLIITMRKALPVFLTESEREDLGDRVVPLALLLMVVAVGAGRLTSYFEPTGFLLPVAAAGILFAILINSRAATVFSLLLVFLVSIQYNFDWRLMFVGGAMSISGILSITKVRRRSDMTKACFQAMGAGLFAMVAILLATDSLFAETAVQRLTMVLLNGGICLMAVPALLSPLERLFRITTDIQLLEYSDLNNEVLSKLALEIPGTFSHSLMLGQLAEAAADAIGANGLKARVMAYYHDIGKMWRPEYFCENQTDRNIHDELAPRLSARAIAAHVSQGAEMARRVYRLPEPIVDGILEHHGTARIGYFYEEAMKQKRHGDVDEKDFRYPGPKPQSPETAILMICDGAESASRTLKNPNEERVRELVDKIIQARNADRQFDDCNLTLKQLDTIAEVVAQRICSNLHTRVVYPATRKDGDSQNSQDSRGDFKRGDDNIIPIAGGGA